MRHQVKGNSKRARVFRFVVCLILFSACLSAEAQLKGKPKIGVLTPAERQREAAAFREGLRSLGYVEGSNILLDVRSAEGKLERMPELAAALIQSDVDIFFR